MKLEKNETDSDPFEKCETCGYRLATKETLRRHELVHSDKRYWLCSKCPTKFKHYHGAINHGMHKHNEQIVPIRMDPIDPVRFGIFEFFALELLVSLQFCI